MFDFGRSGRNALYNLEILLCGRKSGESCNDEHLPREELIKEQITQLVRLEGAALKPVEKVALSILSG